MKRSSRRRSAWGVALVLSLASSRATADGAQPPPTTSAPTAPTPAPAQPPSTVEALRAAFSAAYEAESKGRHAEALGMFRAVQRERDTASVRYRIGACLEGLGKTADARVAYLQVEEVARPADASVVESSKARAAALAARLSELTVRLDRPSESVTLSIDGEPVQLVEGKVSLYLEPGTHEVAALRVTERVVPVRVSLVAGRSTLVVLGLGGAAIEDSTPPPQVAAPSTHEGRTLGLVGVGVGAALLVGAVVTLFVRDSAIGAIEEACPSGACPRAKADTVDAAAARARAMVPVGIACGAAGALAIGAGTWLLLRPSHDRDGRVAGVSMGVGGRF